ncbi:class I SAM-dependent methyltransferase [Streptomyces huiliensis]|uniref:class I SAM-dependent methyltransferase n=1 Tax=Streptomyces huiliensis TaxID=2876027 RepID=UPI001CBB4D47|nr:class I SAM-dependent methyltransferase [Streptomyces huiliensis]MBZ4320835.1 class I SAM-dependent methyltransferase [Streptomyces huiliensis]
MGTSAEGRAPGGDGGLPGDRGAPAVPPVVLPESAVPGTDLPEPAPPETALPQADAPPIALPSVALPSVALTSLWTLHHRASAARRNPPLLHDPVAVALVDRCAWPLETWFGRPRSLPEQYLARRARLYDAAVAEFLRARPGATVIALGEGLETQFWRVGDGTAHWLSVDLPEVLDLRRAVLPHGRRQRAVGCSATDPRWAERAATEAPVLISAQGLLMYLSPAETTALVRLCAGHFPRGTLLFDTLPEWVAHRTARRFMTWGGTFRFPPLRATRRSSYLRTGPGRDRYTVTEHPIGPYVLGTCAAARPLHLAQRSRWVREVFLPTLVRLDPPAGR